MKKRKISLIAHIHGHGGGRGVVDGGPPHDGENFGLPGTLKNKGGPGGGDFRPPKAAENFFTPPGYW